MDYLEAEMNDMLAMKAECEQLEKAQRGRQVLQDLRAKIKVYVDNCKK